MRFSKNMKAYLNEHLTDTNEAWCHPLRKLEIISKVASFFAIVSFVFVIFSAIVTFYLLQIASPTAPIEYVVFVILSNIVPYLFIAVLSLVIKFTAGRTEEENPEKGALPAAQPEAVNA